MPRVDVALLPEHLPSEQQIASNTLIVVDVLRASTTIISALDAGTRSITPATSVEDARSIAQSDPDLILCGERDGLPPQGFQLGNSPLEYTPEIVSDQRLVLTTTNGTRALSMVGDSPKVLIGAITNSAAVCNAAERSDITILCAGTHRQISLDDAIAAGLIVVYLSETLGYTMSETATLVDQATRRLIDEAGSIEHALRNTSHGKRLITLGMGRDIEYASRLDSSVMVGRYDPKSNTIKQHAPLC